jgi:hypothetical protein
MLSIFGEGRQKWDIETCDLLFRRVKEKSDPDVDLERAREPVHNV